MPQSAGAQTSLGSLGQAVTGVYFVTPLVGFPTSLMPQSAGAQTSLGSLEQAVTGVYFVTLLFASLPP
jgi:hypothetical protein